MSNIDAGNEPEPEPTGPDPAAEIRGRLFIARGRYTHEEFAARVGVYPETIGNYESGKTRRMSWRTLRDIAAASDVPGVTLDWLIGDWVKPPKGDEMSADPLVIAHPSRLAHA